MLGIPFRYLLKHPVTGVADLAADPLQVWLTIHDTHAAVRERSRPPCAYEPDGQWERHLHESLKTAWPCSEAAAFRAVWQAANAELEAKGIQPGPLSFQNWNDGDAGFVRAIWCLIRHLRPKKIVETGVAHGVTSRCILEALERNGEGHLWSIDLPPLERDWRRQVGAAVGKAHVERWTYIAGSSRRRLPELLARLGPIDLFIHDSLHSERNVRFELDRAWGDLMPPGALVVDDVDANWGFRSFTQSHAGQRAFIGEAEPLRPDLRRFNHKGLFGVILRERD